MTSLITCCYLTITCVAQIGLPCVILPYDTLYYLTIVCHIRISCVTFAYCFHWFYNVCGLRRGRHPGHDIHRAAVTKLARKSIDCKQCRFLILLLLLLLGMTLSVLWLLLLLQLRWPLQHSPPVRSRLHLGVFHSFVPLFILFFSLCLSFPLSLSLFLLSLL